MIRPLQCFDGDGEPFTIDVHFPLSARAERILRRATTPPAELLAQSIRAREAYRQCVEWRREQNRAHYEEAAWEELQRQSGAKRAALLVTGLRERWLADRARAMAGDAPC